jgi:hypothetical protein
LALERRRVSPPEASQRAMTDPMPPVPMTATHGRNLLGVTSLLGVTVLTAAAQSIDGPSGLAARRWRERLGR